MTIAIAPHARRVARPTATFMAVVAGALLSACGGDDPDPTRSDALSVVLSPAAVSIPAGGEATVLVSVTRSGSVGDVQLSLGDLPAGLAGTFTPVTLGAGTSTSTLTLAAAASAEATTRTIAVRASGSGATASAPLAATVTAVARDIVWTFCAFPDAPIPVWVAVQDGDGPWTRVDPEGAATWRFGLTGDRGGIAIVRDTPPASPAAIEVFFGTPAELRALGTGQCGAGRGAGRQVNGSVAPLQTPGEVVDYAVVSLGGRTATVPHAGGAFTLGGVPDGPLDLVAARHTWVAVSQGFERVADRMVIRRGLDPAPGTALPVVDFEAAEAFATVRGQLRVELSGEDRSALSTRIVTTAGTGGVILADTLQGFTGPVAVPITLVPEARMQPGELHAIEANAWANTAPPYPRRRTATLYRRHPGTDEVQLALGPALPEPTFAVVGASPNVRVRSDGSLPTGYDRMLTVRLSQADGAATRTMTIRATNAWLQLAGGGSGVGLQYSIASPDLSPAAGWNRAWEFARVRDILAEVTGTGWSAGDALSPAIAEGTLVRSATAVRVLSP